MQKNCSHGLRYSLIVVYLIFTTNLISPYLATINNVITMVHMQMRIFATTSFTHHTTLSTLKHTRTWYLRNITTWSFNYAITWVNSWSMSLCLASFCVTEVVGAEDAAQRLIESFTSSSFSSRDWISISVDFHDLPEPPVGEVVST